MCMNYSRIIFNFLKLHLNNNGSHLDQAAQASRLGHRAQHHQSHLGKTEASGGVTHSSRKIGNGSASQRAERYEAQKHAEPAGEGETLEAEAAGGGRTTTNRIRNRVEHSEW